MNNGVAAHRKGPVTLYRAPQRVARPSHAAKRASALRVTIVAAWKQPVISQLHGWPQSRHVHELASIILFGELHSSGEERMSATTILWGQIPVVFAIVLIAVWGATQWTAWRLGFQPQLG